MKTLGSIVKNIRSKNAGPYWVTIDVFCKNKKSFFVICNKLNSELLSKTFKIKKNKIKTFQIDNLNVYKISFPRSLVQGHMKDRDMHGAQYSLILSEMKL
tara:strand:- start:168 stop:467 length:300 start_codon:yes stop_codon:yes gene_type:complete